MLSKAFAFVALLCVVNAYVGVAVNDDNSASGLSAVADAGVEVPVEQGSFMALPFDPIGRACTTPTCISVCRALGCYSGNCISSNTCRCYGC